MVLGELGPLHLLAPVERVGLLLARAVERGELVVREPAEHEEEPREVHVGRRDADVDRLADLARAEEAVRDVFVRLEEREVVPGEGGFDETRREVGRLSGYGVDARYEIRPALDGEPELVHDSGDVRHEVCAGHPEAVSWRDELLRMEHAGLGSRCG